MTNLERLKAVLAPLSALQPIHAADLAHLKGRDQPRVVTALRVIDSLVALADAAKWQVHDHPDDTEQGVVNALAKVDASIAAALGLEGAPP